MQQASLSAGFVTSLNKKLLAQSGRSWSQIRRVMEYGPGGMLGYDRVSGDLLLMHVDPGHGYGYAEEDDEDEEGSAMEAFDAPGSIQRLNAQLTENTDPSHVDERGVFVI